MKRIIASFIFTDQVHLWEGAWARKFHLLSDKTIQVDYSDGSYRTYGLVAFEMEFKTNLVDLLTEHHVHLSEIQWTTAA